MNRHNIYGLLSALLVTGCMFLLTGCGATGPSDGYSSTVSTSVYGGYPYRYYGPRYGHYRPPCHDHDDCRPEHPDRPETLPIKPPDSQPPATIQPIPKPPASRPPVSIQPVPRPRPKPRPPVHVGRPRPRPRPAPRPVRRAPRRRAR